MPLTERTDTFSKSNWSLENSISYIREHILGRKNEIVLKNEFPFGIESNNGKFKINEDPSELKENYMKMIEQIAVVFGAEKGDQLKIDVEDLVAFEVLFSKVSRLLL